MNDFREVLGFIKKGKFGKASYANDRRKLNRKLKKAGIEFEWIHSFDGYQWLFPQLPEGDAIIHSYSYGNKYGHFETYHMPWDDGDVTEMTADELVKTLKENIK